MSTRSLGPTENPPVAIHRKIKRFKELADMIKEIHERKAHDYGLDSDPHVNFNRAEHFGVRPFTGLMLRLNDKVVRIQSYITKGSLLNEPVHDSLLDIATYALIGLVMIEEEQDKGVQGGPVQDRTRS